MRRAAGLSQAALADRVGVPQQHVAGWDGSRHRRAESLDGCQPEPSAGDDREPFWPHPEPPSRRDAARPTTAANRTRRSSGRPDDRHRLLRDGTGLRVDDRAQTSVGTPKWLVPLPQLEARNRRHLRAGLEWPESATATSSTCPHAGTSLNATSMACCATTLRSRFAASVGTRAPATAGYSPTSSSSTASARCTTSFPTLCVVPPVGKPNLPTIHNHRCGHLRLGDQHESGVARCRRR